MKSYFVFIPLVTLAVAVAGSALTAPAINTWYKTINLPPWTPSGQVIGTVWTIIFILTAISALITWNTAFEKASLKKRLPVIAKAFIFNAILNVSWSYIFFNQHLLNLAVFEAGVLGFSVLVLIILIRPVSRLASNLLVPYLLWVCFATYLTYSVYVLNRPV